MLGFAISFDQSVVDDFLSSTAFFTASAAGVVAGVLCYSLKDFSDLLHLHCALMSFWDNVWGTECRSQQFLTSPAVWVPKAPSLWL